jgi:hypothetical protein
VNETPVNPSLSTPHGEGSPGAQHAGLLKAGFNTQSRRRWTDQDPTCRELINHLKTITQPDILDFACNLIVQLSEEIGQAIRTRNGSAPKTLGPAGIKEKYLGKQMNKRWYDHKPNLKRAIGGFYTLPLYGLSALCFKLEEPIGLLATYGYMCEQLGQNPSEADLSAIIKISLFKGGDEGRTFLSELVGVELFEALLADRQAQQTG